MPIACSLCTLPIVRPLAVNKCPACGDDVHTDCLNQHFLQKHQVAFDCWNATQGRDLRCYCHNTLREHDCGKRPDICDCCVEAVIRNHNRSQKKKPNAPNRKTNRSMTKTAIVKYVASKNDVTQRQVRDMFKTLEDLALREIEENGTFTIPDMVRLITKERKALDHNGRPRKVLTCEPRQHFKCAARNCTAFIEEVD